MPSARAVCFDLLSALLDGWSTWDGVAAALGAPASGRAWRLGYLARTSSLGAYVPYLDVVRAAAVDVGLPSGAAEALARAWDGLRPWPDVPGALAGLRLPRAVVTNCSEALGARAVACVGADFDLVVTAERAGAYKPDPRPYALAARELGLPPDAIAFVAGSPFDAEGALRAGFQVTWVNRLAAPVPSSLTGVEVRRGLDGWSPG